MSAVMPMTFRLLIITIAFVLGIYFCMASPNENAEGFDTVDTNSNTVTLSTDTKCPNLLIQEDGGISLMNTKEKRVPGINPMRFNNLEEYVQFVEWQKSQGVSCPVLFLQKTEDTQGTVSYRVRPDIVNPQGGLQNMSLEQMHQRCGNMPMNSGLTAMNDVNVASFFTEGCGDITGEIALNTGPDDIKLIDGGRNDLPYNDNSMPAFDPSSFYQGKITPMDKILENQKELEQSPSAMDTNWGGKEYTRSLISKGEFDGRRRKLIETNDIYIDKMK